MSAKTIPKSRVFSYYIVNLRHDAKIAPAIYRRDTFIPYQLLLTQQVFYGRKCRPAPIPPDESLRDNPHNRPTWDESAIFYRPSAGPLSQNTPFVIDHTPPLHYSPNTATNTACADPKTLHQFESIPLLKTCPIYCRISREWLKSSAFS